ncbi:hypothetical protein J2X46_002743 [Nocardioides sp. BE266]|uniref:DUF7432 family protein n=1 Tax=Nocardioides sp. BE266 TaxID=2817725 RepID=UPI002861F646|nr:hypothetical protein [Nocardioides sp. BE266]MDR7253753.1 hypothetical protein [Nocardioides sp. BE266]
MSDWQRQGHLVAQIPSEHLTRHPALGAHLLAAVAEADRLGLIREADGSIRIPLTDDELDVKVKSEQRSWDWNAERWEKSMAGDTEVCPTWARSGVDAWAKAEGRDLVDWSALDEEAAR